MPACKKPGCAPGFRLADLLGEIKYFITNDLRRYESVYGDITFDEVKFPDPKNMIDELHNRDFRVTIWVTPFVNKASTNYNTHPEYFVKNGDGDPGRVAWWDGVGRMIDFTNTDACDW